MEFQMQNNFKSIELVIGETVVKIETTECGPTLEQFVENLIVPALLASGFHPETVGGILG